MLGQYPRVISLAVLALSVGSATFAAGAESFSTNLGFSIQQQGETAWLVRPNGERFFSLGVCVVSQGASRKEFDPVNPGYAAWQHYADSNLWARATLKRLKAWNFTTVGGWSDFQVLKHNSDPDVAFAPVLHIGSTAGAPWWDMWDRKITDRMDAVAREQILALRDDPRLIGYYSDNEMGWWNAILFKMTLEQASTSRQRQRLIQLLRETHQNDWSKLLRDFEPAPGVENWDTLSQHGMLFLRPGGNGVRVQRRFLELLADRYYSLVRDIIRKYDRRALILGDRYQSFYYPEVARACSRYVDAVSSNLNASWNDGTFARFYVETLHRLAGKPVLIGEFYMSARENRSGNKNTRGAFPVVATQKERAAGFHNTLHALVRIPYVIGADWFQYYDEPTHGRYDGENFNFGLVDIHDRPYEALTKTASALNLVALKSRPHQRDWTLRKACRPRLEIRWRNLNRCWRSSIGTVNVDSFSRCRRSRWPTCMSAGTRRRFILGCTRRTSPKILDTRTRSCARVTALNGSSLPADPQTPFGAASEPGSSR